MVGFTRLPPCRFQSTHPVRGATFVALAAETAVRISIHAPRAGCDAWEGAGASAPPHFNPRTPCGVRQNADALAETIKTISIHAPRAGCDSGEVEDAIARAVFQSTHPVRGATHFNG